MYENCKIAVVNMSDINLNTISITGVNSNVLKGNDSNAIPVYLNQGENCRD